ncbi:MULTISPECIES: DUF6728 family protein [Sphingobacterium]|nr:MULTISPECIES: DUF6728 family protein [Sphingobacterium]
MKKADNTKPTSIRVMYIINAIAIILFLLGIIYKIFIDK